MSTSFTGKGGPKFAPIQAVGKSSTCQTTCIAIWLSIQVGPRRDTRHVWISSPSTAKCNRIFLQVSEISSVRRAGNPLSARITWRFTGGPTQEKHRSSKLLKQKTDRSITHFCTGHVRLKSLFFSLTHVFCQMWNLWLPVSPARVPELAHEETHSRGPVQLHLRVLWEEVREAGQC